MTFDHVRHAASRRFSPTPVWTVAGAAAVGVTMTALAVVPPLDASEPVAATTVATSVLRAPFGADPAVAVRLESRAVTDAVLSPIVAADPSATPSGPGADDSAGVVVTPVIEVTPDAEAEPDEPASEDAAARPGAQASETPDAETRDGGDAGRGSSSSSSGTTSPSGGTPSTGLNVVLADDLSSARTGTLQSSYLKDHWNATTASGVSRASVVSEGGNRFVRVLYPRGAVGATNSGVTWRAQLPSTDVATAQYRVRFEPGFDWTSGGKLPGLTGGSSPSGGNATGEGFTARYMWQPNGRLILYLYHSEQSSRYGDSLSLGHTMVPGRWHTLSQQVVLNTPGVADGELRVWVDGRLALERTSMRWRTAGNDWTIDSFYFNTFHGGNSDAYRPSRDNHADFDDVTVKVK